jgi:hypothetical protein
MTLHSQIFLISKFFFMKRVKIGKKRRKIAFFEIKIDLKLRFDIKNVLTIKRNDAHCTHNFIEDFHNHKVFKDSVPNGTYRVYSQVLKISSTVSK